MHRSRQWAAPFLYLGGDGRARRVRAAALRRVGRRRAGYGFGRLDAASQRGAERPRAVRAAPRGRGR